MSIPRKPSDGQQTDPPASSIRLSPELVEEGNRALDELDALFDRPKPPGDGDDDEPPTSRTPPAQLSRLAVRLDDLAFLVSLEDAADRDLFGREVVSFLVLRADEVESARATVSDALFDAAANVVGRLPKRST